MKKCNSCGETKSVDDFSFRNKAAGTRQPYCRLCKRVADNAAYKPGSKRADSVAAAVKRQRVLKRDKVRALLIASGCVDCGNNDVRVLEYDHTGSDKVAGVMKLVNTGASWTRIEAEIAKCEVRCKNCHAIKTYERGGFTY